jgi:hypothetical protein
MFVCEDGKVILAGCGKSVKRNNGTNGSNGNHGIRFWISGPCLFRIALLRRPLATPPVVWKPLKKTETHQ